MNTHSHEESSEGDTLAGIIGHFAHLLPAQGPIGVFVHHNTLHAFQHLAFEEAVLQASRVYGTEPYMTEDAYRLELQRGRILREDVDAVLAEEVNETILESGLDRIALRRALLLSLDSVSDSESLAWQLEEDRGVVQDAAALFDVCLRRLPEEDEAQPASHAARPRDGILAETSVDIDEFVEPMLIRLCGAYLDQGLAYWPMPGREHGFYRACCRLLAQPGGVYGERLKGLSAECRRQLATGFDAEASVMDSLLIFNVKPEERSAFIGAELLAMPGWAGMFHRLEQEPTLAPHTQLPARLMDYLAIRLILNRVVVSSVVNGKMSVWKRTRRDQVNEPLRHASAIFYAARALGLQANDLNRLSDREFRRLATEAILCDSVERRRLFHLAYERRHERQVLLPLRAHRKLLCESSPPSVPTRPLAQVFFCLDERSESMRRALEETEPRIETFGAAGFFGVAIDYAGIEDGNSVSLCPVVVSPQHAVRETVSDGQGETWQRWVAMRRLWARLARSGYIGSRSLLRGWIATASLGVLSLFPLIARILTPRQFARLRERLNDVLIPRPKTELAFRRESEETLDGLQRGFGIAEKADRVAGVLSDAGLVSGFSRLVLVLGHGSTSLNNPLESAYDCGACGGHRGGPNGRLFAAMANLPGVRSELATRGIVIPDDTWFVGGDHDTCSDDVELYDLNKVPQSHLDDLREVENAIRKARGLDALERSRRFEFADSCSDPDDALRHVEERSEHLAEPRPEYGHCTNAVCIVGPRSSTRGLFLDRRAFLVSYDASKDPDDKHLARQLAAVVPVCAGISLEYYFSSVDNEGYGCGTKLPHNVSGLLGVMTGHASDLRTGLAWQMVEIHEPMRILFVVETAWPRLLATIEGDPTVKEFVVNRWIRMAAMDPATGDIHIYRNGVFRPLEDELLELPTAKSSYEWYRGHREHLPIARIVAREGGR